MAIIWTLPFLNMCTLLVLEPRRIGLETLQLTCLLSLLRRFSAGSAIRALDATLISPAPEVSPHPGASTHSENPCATCRYREYSRAGRWVGSGYNKRRYRGR